MNQGIPRARRNDRRTSHIAAQRLRALRSEQQRILRLFEEFHSLTDSELEQIAIERKFPMAGKTYYRRRRSDLKNMGLIRATCTRRTNQHGNSETVWILTQRKDTSMAIPEGISFDEGTIIFTNIGQGEFAIMGVNLTPGQTVTVTKKNGQTVDVIVGNIIDEDNGIHTATYTDIDSR